MNTCRTEIGPFLKISHVFLDQKWLIIAITFLVTLLTGILIYKQNPIYEAKVIIGPPILERVSMLHSLPFIYLHSSQESDFSASELLDMFTQSFNRPLVKILFYAQVYLPLFHPEEKNRSILSGFYSKYIKEFKILNHYSNMQNKLTITFTSDSSLNAINKLKKFISFVNQKANEQFKQIQNARKKTIAFALWQQINLLKKIETVSKKNNFDNKNFLPSIAPLFIELSEKKLNFYNIPLNPNNTINLFKYDSEIIITHLAIESRPKKTLILGIAGGLILGFFVASLRISMKSSQI